MMGPAAREGPTPGTAESPSPARRPSPPTPTPPAPAPAVAPSGAFVFFSCAKWRVVDLSGKSAEMRSSGKPDCLRASTAVVARAPSTVTISQDALMSGPSRDGSVRIRPSGVDHQVVHHASRAHDRGGLRCDRVLLGLTLHVAAERDGAGTRGVRVVASDECERTDHPGECDRARDAIHKTGPLVRSWGCRRFQPPAPIGFSRRGRGRPSYGRGISGSRRKERGPRGASLERSRSTHGIPVPRDPLPSDHGAGPGGSLMTGGYHSRQPAAPLEHGDDRAFG